MNEETAPVPDESIQKALEAEAEILSARKKMSRRNFLLRLGIYGSILLTAGNGLLEPKLLAVRRYKKGTRGKKVVHLTDLHYKGGRSFLENVVRRINKEKPDAVLCTGDFVEKSEHLAEALDILKHLQSPLFAVPGNHDYWSRASFTDLAACCEKTGGRWLEDAEHLHDGWLHLTGITDVEFPTKKFGDQVKTDATRVLLAHYPAVVDTIAHHSFDLILAGHSHGGQIRLPGIGALMLPHNVGQYDLGWFSLPCGPLHVSAGVGTYFIPIRFFCRPDITIIEL